MPDNAISGNNVDAPVEERLGNLIENLSSYIEYYHGGWCKLVLLLCVVGRVVFVCY
jgi:hypothetical protein